MKILILDPDRERRQQLVGACDWLEIKAEIHEASHQTQADQCLKYGTFDMVLIGPELAMGTLLTVMYLRRRLPQSYLVVCDPTPLIQLVNPGHLMAAGANLIIDTPVSPWQTAVLLRPLVEARGNSLARPEPAPRQPLHSLAA